MLLLAVIIKATIFHLSRIIRCNSHRIYPKEACKEKFLSKCALSRSSLYYERQFGGAANLLKLNRISLSANLGTHRHSFHHKYYI